MTISDEMIGAFWDRELAGDVAGIPDRHAVEQMRARYIKDVRTSQKALRQIAEAHAMHLAAAMERAGWKPCGGRAGAYIRLQRPTSAWKNDVSTLIPLDASAADFDDLLQAVIQELELIAERGRLARLVLDELHPVRNIR
jgi:hypothetical protein